LTEDMRCPSPPTCMNVSCGDRSVPMTTDKPVIPSRPMIPTSIPASNVHEALGYLRQRVDVVITDIHLGGGLTGWDVAEEFRAARSGIPIIYTSGNAVDGARKVSGSVFFGKPFRTADILKVCRGLGYAAGSEPRSASPIPAG
jgi:hypothetical protein